MGIRIHKVLGYGLTDVKYDEKNWKMTDARFNPKGYFGDNDVYKREEDFTDSGFDEYVSKITGDTGDNFHDLYIMQRERKKALDENGHTTESGKQYYNYKDTIDNCVTYDSEYGLSNVMVFTPPYWGKSWTRYDDIIDYYDPQNSDDDGGIHSDYQLLHRPIYPFDGWQDCRTTPPTRLDGTNFRLFADSRNAINYQEALETNLINRMEFNDVEDMRNNINVIIPLELVELLKYLKVFNDEKDIYLLKPMIYWYWG